jgi:tRNA uridine 5-carboxymethylaminomethyl modification enzyme
LEPEGLKTDLVYPNGMSGPYPEEIQLQILRSMKGLEEVEIVRPGYDVEYDFVNPTALTHTLETKKIAGLYLAGQICGTTVRASRFWVAGYGLFPLNLIFFPHFFFFKHCPIMFQGYEEAAAQGIIAGANAGRAAAAAAGGLAPPTPFVLGRDEGYIGVLIDDLVTRGTSEPYRMFTSRAEYRISLRADNADLRLTRKGAEHGLIRDEERMAAVEAREYLIEGQIDQLKSFSLKVTDWAKRGGEDLMGGAQMSKKEGTKKTAEEVLYMPHVTLKSVEDIMMEVTQQEREQSVMEEGGSADGVATMSREIRLSPPSVYDTVEAAVKYQSYVSRQHKDMESWRKAQGIRIPPDLVYVHDNFPTFSGEEIEKLSKIRPATFADASQISGMTPQSLVYLYHHVTRRNRKRDTSRGGRSGGGGGATATMDLSE